VAIGVESFDRLADEVSGRSRHLHAVCFQPALPGRPCVEAVAGPEGRLGSARRIRPHLSRRQVMVVAGDREESHPLSRRAASFKPRVCASKAPSDADRALAARQALGIAPAWGASTAGTGLPPPPPCGPACGTLARTMAIPPDGQTGRTCHRPVSYHVSPRTPSAEPVRLRSPARMCYRWPACGHRQRRRRRRPGAALGTALPSRQAARTADIATVCDRAKPPPGARSRTAMHGGRRLLPCPCRAFPPIAIWT
jgi:hypothetical protein